jgi:glucose/arabinose dehydrogenase
MSPSLASPTGRDYAPDGSVVDGRRPYHREVIDSRGSVRHVALTLVAGLICIACTSATAPSGTSSPPESPSATTASPTPDLAAAQVHLVQIASLDQPLALAVRPDDPALYVAEKPGRVVAVRGGTADPVPVLDLTHDVSIGSEQGLLGLAFSPDGRFMYVNFTDPSGDTHVTEFAMKNGRARPASRRDVLFVDQPYANHNGGNLVFGPDGYLYIGLGDGGSGGDPQGNAQSLSTLLGKMLRISPRPSGTKPYGIPSDNPFVGMPGDRPEIWANGLRNPWRYSFDRVTGALWIGDVGQSTWEEVDVQPSGAPSGLNYGWDLMEGSHAFEDAAPPSRAVLPVFDYSHANGGCVVTGGHVYRGEAIPDLYGAYVFADFCLGRLEALRLQDGSAVDHRELGPTIADVSSFGEDAAGELYAMSLDGGLYKLVPGP